IAAGRIRNLREYVSVGKKVVCKVLKITNDHFDLSLRRVTAKEKIVVFNRHKEEIAFRNVLKIIGEDPEILIPKIKETYFIYEFVDEARSNPSLLEKYIEKSKAEKLSKLLVEKKEKDKNVKSFFILKSNSEHGLKDIKETLDFKEEIHYLGSGRYSLNVLANNFKEANIKISTILESIAEKAKKKKMIFEIKKSF
ncbi:MAG: hypothetical protein AAB835_00260, partial [Patescibacteria group bacterium]